MWTWFPQGQTRQLQRSDPSQHHCQSPWIGYFNAFVEIWLGIDVKLYLAVEIHQCDAQYCKPKFCHVCRLPQFLDLHSRWCCNVRVDVSTGSVQQVSLFRTSDFLSQSPLAVFSQPNPRRYQFSFLSNDLGHVEMNHLQVASCSLNRCLWDGGEVVPVPPWKI